MASKTESHQWQLAFARQAQVEFSAWQSLQADRNIAPCVRLHLLQMVCEKLAKAYLCSAGSSPGDIQSSHAYVAKNLPVIAKQFLGSRGRQPGQFNKTLIEIKLLAQEIEWLHPNPDADGKRPDNCEYPWQDASGAVRSPADHQFSRLNLLTAPAGKTLLKIIHLAIEKLIGNPSSARPIG